MILLLLLLSACGISDSNAVGQTESSEVRKNVNLVPPVMHIIYEKNGIEKESFIKSQTYNWNEKVKDNDRVGIFSDGAAPLDEASNSEKINIQGNTFRILFEDQPYFYEAGYWTDDNISKGAYADEITKLECTDDKISLPDTNKGYIVEIHAVWKQGDAYFYVHIINDSV